MSTLGIQMIACVCQVTMLLVVAAAVYSWAVRRGPRLASWTLTCFLAMTVILTPLAFAPLPSIWPSGRWVSIPPSIVRQSRQPVGELRQAQVSVNKSLDTGDRPDEANVPHWSWNTLAALFGNHGFRLSDGQHSRWSQWSSVITILLVGFASAGLIRWLAGLWHIASLLRRSVAIDDANLYQEIERLRHAMQVAVPVRLLMCQELHTPATVGWVRPAILFPANWRTWSESEIRAVLAHELAHIGCRDYLAWLLAQLSLSIHAYHPLAHWLVGRLQLQQEIAADASAAEGAGSRYEYLRALASMSLRQDEDSRSLLAAAFLPSQRLLLRRIAMLRVMEDRSSQLTRRAGWCICLIGLITAGVLTLTLRMQAGEDPTSNKSTVKVEAKTSESPQSADETTRPKPTELGVIVMRPARFFAHSEVRQLLPVCNQSILAQLKEANLSFNTEAHLDCVEEFSGRVSFAHDDTKTEHANSLMVSGDYARFTNSVDLASWFQRVMPGTQVHRDSHATSYVLPAQILEQIAPAMGMSREAAVIVEPVPRTIMLNGVSEDVAAEYASGTKKWQGGPVGIADWSRVDRGILSFAVNENIREIARHIKDDSEQAWLKPSLSLVDRAMGFVELEEEFRAELYLATRSEKDAESLRAQIESLVALGRALLSAAKSNSQSGEPGQGDAQTDTLRILAKLLESATVQCERSEVRVVVHADVEPQRVARHVEASLRTQR